MATAAPRQDLIPDESTWPPGLSEEIKNELRLRRALQEHLYALGEKVARGEIEVTSADLSAQMNEIAERYGCEYGIPIPSAGDVNRRMVLARGTPLSRIPLNHATELEEELVSQKIQVRNSWSMLGDKEVCIVQTEEGPIVLPRYHAGVRLRKLLDGLGLRHGSQQTAEAEMRAVESLKQRIGPNKWETYVLSGIFAEKSPRSDIHYFFRKGLPTIAVSYHSGYHGDYSGGKVLACLCLHPLGYYSGSHVGIMCPTDEVICALLMMRGDEHGYWKACGQWSASDSRSGI